MPYLERAMRAGPKPSVDNSELPFRSSRTGSARFAAFCEKFIKVPKGTGPAHRCGCGTGSGIWLRRCSTPIHGPAPPGGCCRAGKANQLARRSACTTFTAAMRVRSSVSSLSTSARPASSSASLAAWSTVGRAVVTSSGVQGSAVHPRTGRPFSLPTRRAKRLEGLDYTLALLDEAGVVNRDSYEVLTLAQGKREHSTLIAIGTPGPDPHNHVLADLRTYAADHPDDTSLVWREFSAAGFEDHPVDCQHCWELANPALGDFLHRDAMHALLPPKTREATFRRARLCQFATDTEGAFLPPGVWDGLSTGEPVPDGAEVVIALDGSFSDDTTALLVGTVVSRTALRHAAGVAAAHRRSRIGCRSPRWSRRSATRADAGRWWRSSPTRSAGPAPCRRWRPRGCPSWSSRTRRPG